MRESKHLVRLDYSKLRTITSIYLSIPVLIFLIGYIKWYYAAIGVGAIVYSLYDISRKKEMVLEEKQIELPIWNIIVAFFLVLIWTHLGGMNGYWYQSTDYSVRNAILRDLITHSWPVTYQGGNTALVYYIGHWFPAAAIGKIIAKLFGSIQTAWIAARVSLWIWSSIGLTILVLLLFLFLKADTLKKKIITILVLFFFSGMDIIGSLLENKLSTNLSPDVLHLEWWSPKNWQFSSITTCVFWVFNQAIVPWIITMLVLIDTNPRYYMLYIASSLICAPMPTVGLSFLILGKELVAFVKTIRTHSIKQRIQDIFSPTNLLTLVLCIPLLIAFFLASNSAGSIEAKTAIEKDNSIISTLINFGFFYLLEAGVLLCLLWSRNKKDAVFYSAGLSLLIIPFIHVGHGTDFCMRGSIPAIFVLMVYTLEFLVSSKNTAIEGEKRFKQKYLTVTLIIALVIGSVTPVVEIFRGIYHVVDKRNIELTNDSLYSFENESDSYNFTTANYKEYLFFSTFAKDH